MNTALVYLENGDGNLKNGFETDVKYSPERSTILIATVDPEIRSGLTELLHDLPFRPVWLKSVEAAKSMLGRERIAACLCGFWLQDGTYRELVRYIRRERAEIPVIIVSAPVCPDEYRDYLAAANIGAVDFLGYPYRKSDLQRMLWSDIEANTVSAGSAVTPGFGVRGAA